MTGTARTFVSAAAAVGGLGILLWASAAGPAHLAPHAPTYFHAHGAADHSAPQLKASGGGGFPSRPPLTGVDLSWLQSLLAWSAVLVACAAGGGVLWWLWNHRPPGRQRPAARPGEPDVEPLPDLRDLREVMARRTDTLVAVLADGSPREGVIRCWLALEQLVGELGVRRAPAETSTELTVRLLHALDLDPRAVGMLAALYREARFSGHHLDEAARTTAHDLLERLRQELGMPDPTAAGRR